jgi:hypothetical protein
MQAMESPFAAKLELVLKILSLSRARLAADLAVDKSVVGRWASGAVIPSAHNMAALTRYVAGRRPGFTMLDWDRDVPDLARLLGVERPGTPVAGLPRVDGMPLPLLAMAREATAERAADLESFFRTTRPAEMAPGNFLHDAGMLRLHENGLLEVRMGIGQTLFEGWLLPIRSQLICIASETMTGSMVFAIFHAPPSGRPKRLDGISLGTSQGPLSGVAAAPVILDRVGELSGDREKDEATYREMLTQNPLSPPSALPDDVRIQLTRDYGPSHYGKEGGEWVLKLPYHRSLSAVE